VRAYCATDSHIGYTVGQLTKFLRCQNFPPCAKSGCERLQKTCREAQVASLKLKLLQLAVMHPRGSQKKDDR